MTFSKLLDFFRKWSTLKDCVVTKTFHLDGLIGNLKGDIHVCSYLVATVTLSEKSCFDRGKILKTLPGLLSPKK